MPAAHKRKAAGEPEAVRKSPKFNDRAKSANKSTSMPSDSDPAIVGGLKGDYRITGAEQSDDNSGPYREFTIPAEKDKVIPCRLYHPDSQTSQSSERLLIFTHGAGGGIENPATQLFAEGYATCGMGVLCFQGTMNLKNRTKCFGIVLEYCKKTFPGHEFAVGGRSMGARAAVMLAAEHEEVKKIVAASYPLVNEKGEVRDEILIDLGPDKAVFFLTGDKDSMCDLGQLDDVRNKMKASSKVLVARGADHSMSIVGKVEQKEETVASMRKTGGRMAATWVREAETMGDKGTSFLDYVPGEATAAVHSQAELQPHDQTNKAVGAKKRSAGGDKQDQDRARAKDKDTKIEPTASKRKRQSDERNEVVKKASIASKKQKSTPKKSAKRDEEQDKPTPRRSARLRS